MSDLLARPVAGAPRPQATADRPAVTGVICGVGGFVPPATVPNAQLCERLGITDEWIRTRTGIRQRHRVEPGTATSDLAIAAGAAALASAGLDPVASGAVDAIVLATSTPDHHCPATAPAVAAGLGLAGTAAFDVGAVCSGFVYALAAGSGLLAAGVARRVLVIGADTFSTIVHPDDRDSGAVFGDGAGAVVLRAGSSAEPGALLGFDLGSDGAGADLIAIPAGGSRRPRRADDAEEEPGVPQDHWFTMAGRAVYRRAVAQLATSCRDVVAAVGWSSDQVDHYVLHQANQRILASVARELDVEPARMPSNIDQVANTAAASIPLLLAQAAQDGRLRAGQKVVLSAFGGGLAWGSAALVWPGL